MGLPCRQIARVGSRAYVRPTAVLQAAAKKDDGDLVKQLVLSELRKYAGELEAKKKKAVPVPDAIRVAAEADPAAAGHAASLSVAAKYDWKAVFVRLFAVYREAIASYNP